MMLPDRARAALVVLLTLSVFACDASQGLVAMSNRGGKQSGARAEPREGEILLHGKDRNHENKLASGLHRLRIGGGRDGLIYVPESYRPGSRSPLAVMLHGAGGTARGGIRPFASLADRWGVILLAPRSRDRTWDVVSGGYGPDVEYISRALQYVLTRLSVDRDLVALQGFSDGASYALSLGLTNGDLFSSIIAFSPGFLAPARLEGKPPLFISHGTDDGVLPIDSTSRHIVPRLRRSGYRVRYEEFLGGHAVPPVIAQEAMKWWLGHPK